MNAVFELVKVAEERLTKQWLIEILLTTNAVSEWNFNSLSEITPRFFSSDTSNKLPSI